MQYNLQRPNRVTTNKKDKEYHSSYAKWVLSCMESSNQREFIYKSLINWSFYKGNQWLFHEDLDAFLMDESGESRNRIRFMQNIIRPFVEYYRGSAIRMDISARAFSVSTQAIDRREKAKEEIDVIFAIYQAAPDKFKPEIKASTIIGETEEENNEIFINTYKDEIEENVNNIINFLAQRNDIEDKKVQLIKNVVLDGIGIAKEYERFGSQVVEVVNPRRFIFDHTATSDDLKDAEYMGDWKLSSVADIIEECPDIKQRDIERLEKSSSSGAMYRGMHNIASFEHNGSNGKIPVYYIEWRDIETDEFGAVINDNGVPQLTIINNSNLSPYTDKDLIKEKDLKKHKADNFWIDKALGGSNKKKIKYDAIRYIKFVPSEYIDNCKEDIVLDFGTKSHCNKYSLNYKNPDWSYKIKCWGYDNGEISSPLDDLISPQRFLNRVLSMGEAHINNTRGSGIILDKSTIDPQVGEAETLSSINKGKPVLIDGAVNNSIGFYNNQIGSGTIQLFDVARGMEAAAKNIIGGGESLMGQGGAYRASATVNDQNLTQGNTMQEPVFYCLHKIILDLYTSFGNRGRRILSENQSMLTVVTGEEGVKNIVLTKEYDLEEFRVTIERANNPAQERQGANEQLLSFLQLGLIDHEIFAKYYNKSNLSTLGTVIRERAMLMIEARKQQEKMAKIQQEKMANAEEANMQLQDLDGLADMQIAKQMQGENAMQNRPTGEDGLSYGDSKYIGQLLERDTNRKSLS